MVNLVCRRLITSTGKGGEKETEFYGGLEGKYGVFWRIC